jgi:propionyl-CoA carboxylase alpha chain
LEIPGVDVEFGALRDAGLRLDSGFESGSEVGTHYDAMLAKVIAWAPTRAQAARRLAGALERARLHGPVTNRDLLVASLRHETFLAGEVSTDFFDLHPGVLGGRRTDLEPAAFAAAVMLAEQDRLARRVQRAAPVAWRNVVSQPQRTVLEPVGATGAPEEIAVEWYGGRDGYTHATRTDLLVLEASAGSVLLEVDGVQQRYDGVRSSAGHASSRELFVDGGLHTVRLREQPRFLDPSQTLASGSLLAPMPGSVVQVAVAPGDTVAAGDPILVLEAMKMQHTISAPTDGVVSDLVPVGVQVAAGEVLAVVSSTNDTNDTGPSSEPMGDQS